jgi:hypothetical protein
LRGGGFEAGCWGLDLMSRILVRVSWFRDRMFRGWIPLLIGG